MRQRPPAVQTRALVRRLQYTRLTGPAPGGVLRVSVAAERSGHAQAAWPHGNHVAIHFLAEGAGTDSSVRLHLANQTQKLNNR